MMPPSRTHDRGEYAEKSRSKTTTGFKHRRPRNNPLSESTSTPGVQKVKALLRQTRRLLAKDNLAANVRVETERRLKALEAELGQAEQAKKERTLSVKYHKVKFFERQKVTRKLKQTRKRLEKEDRPSEKKTIAAEIHELNVDLNYVLHYPKTKKYISLFPPEVRKGEDNTSSTDGQKTIEEREKVREWIREQMTKGELPMEPEFNLDSQSRTVKTRTWTKDGPHTTSTTEIQFAEVEQDAFFGDDSGSDNESI